MKLLLYSSLVSSKAPIWVNHSLTPLLPGVIKLLNK
jgi:hypothetical protein